MTFFLCESKCKVFGVVRKKRQEERCEHRKRMHGNELHGQLILTYPLMANLHLP